MVIAEAEAVLGWKQGTDGETKHSGATRVTTGMNNPFKTRNPRLSTKHGLHLIYERRCAADNCPLTGNKLAE
ncbi:hypothetical protein E2C01_060751 [Portunus trituberculatus]|uniref:Uncharacterized protein n=1 Tax=Portunus trituberculatus TaxID=210409 RepID=A0A5B7H221_PORTR|nr:hypothetical protein [Portunus trituberculatus]